MAMIEQRESLPRMRGGIEMPLLDVFRGKEIVSPRMREWIEMSVYRRRRLKGRPLVRGERIEMTRPQNWMERRAVPLVRGERIEMSVDVSFNCAFVSPSHEGEWIEMGRPYTMITPSFSLPRMRGAD